ncbi:MAG: hypothetical protein IKO48_02010 [Elusimicrobia bacterium]|nr:hypothetical protein [Elusimicrobiota bacterium]
MKKILTIVFLLIFTIPCYAKIKSIYNYENNDENSIIKLLSCQYDTKTSDLEIKINIDGRIVDSNNNPIVNKNLSMELRNYFISENLNIVTDENGRFEQKLVKVKNVSNKEIKNFNKSLMDIRILIGLNDNLKLTNCFSFSFHDNSFELNNDDSFSQENKDSSIVKNFISGQKTKILSPIGVIYLLKNISDNVQISRNNIIINEKNPSGKDFSKDKDILGLKEQNIENNSNIIKLSEVEFYSKKNELKQYYIQEMCDVCSDKNFKGAKKYDYIFDGKEKGELASLYLKYQDKGNNIEQEDKNEEDDDELDEYYLYENFYNTDNTNKLYDLRYKKTYMSIYLVNLFFNDKKYIYCFDNEKEQKDLYQRKKDEIWQQRLKGQENYIGDNFNIFCSEISVLKENKSKAKMIADMLVKIKSDYNLFKTGNKDYALVEYSKDEQKLLESRGNLLVDYFNARQIIVDWYNEYPIFSNYLKNPKSYKKVWVVMVVLGGVRLHSQGVCVPDRILYYFFTDSNKFRNLYSRIQLPFESRFHMTITTQYQQSATKYLFKTWRVYLVDKDNVWYTSEEVEDHIY